MQKITKTVFNISLKTGKQVRKQTELQANSSRFNSQLMVLAGASAQLKIMAKQYGLESEYIQVCNMETKLHTRIISTRLKTNNDIRVKLEMKRMQAPTVLPNAPKAQPLVQNVTQEDINRDLVEALNLNYAINCDYITKERAQTYLPNESYLDVDMNRHV